MKKGLIKVIVAIVSFIVSLYVIGSIMNRGNTDMTMEMPEASYPLIYINYEGQHINCLHGYKNEMEPALMRDVITPLTENRELSIYMEKYGNTIHGISYEVRSIDGSRLIENEEIFDYKEENTSISADIRLKDLIDPDTEYMLVLLVEAGDGNPLRFYTRVIERTENYAGEEIRFATEFHNKTYDTNEAQSIATYLETDETGDNTSYANVDIHSSFKQITWGDLQVEQLTDTMVNLTELFAQTARVRLTYFVQVHTEDRDRICRVEECFRLRRGTQRMYLLGYERTMHEVFCMDKSAFTNNKLDLGINTADLEMMESDEGGVFAFVSENRLFSYNSSSNRFARLFAFYDEEDPDERTTYDRNGIHILNVDETGNVYFLVYGYMNRGTHEGNMGIAVYFYNSVLNTIEEQAFIPYNKAFSVLENELNRLVYLNNNNQLFLYMNECLYSIKLEEKSYDVLVSNLSQDNLKVSESNRMIVWSNDRTGTDSTELSLLNLNTSSVITIAAGENNHIYPLGFMEEDLIYGISRSSDRYMDTVGRIMNPMYVVNISEAESNDVSMSYEKDGVYVLDVEIEDNQINMKRVQRNTVSGNYVYTTDDQIMSNATGNVGANRMETVATSNLEKIVQIAAKGNFATKSLKFLTPNEVMYEGGHEIILQAETEEKEKFYVFGDDGVDSIFSTPSEAILYADEFYGTVVDTGGRYVWIKANRAKSNQIMAITEEQISEEKGSLAVCINKMLSLRGYGGNSQLLLDQGETPLSVLESQMTGEKILDLAGCSLDSVLYYVNRDIPVMAIQSDRTAVLIVGFNELNTVILNPQTGEISKMGMNDSASYFNKNGNQFITYIPME
ncbi:MAG: hypothetical protein K6G07_05415 [Lachnospiraceae bacterium]|nr:hypothetical protein [Lachnospiraceae bacterium]